jgi:vibriolysin
MAIQVRLFTNASSFAQHPRVSVYVPSPYKIIGGGALDNWSGAGNLLTGSYPTANTWVASGKDHMTASPATVTAYALAIYDPSNEWDVVIRTATSIGAAQSQQVVAGLPAGYVLTGGGALVQWTGAGNLLTASYPSSPSPGWVVRSKDHGVESPAWITAYALGIRHRYGGVRLATTIKTVTSPVMSHPRALACLDPGWILTGGGALDDWWPGPGNLLTASCPASGSCWSAAGKDHVYESPAKITAYAIGIREV